MSNENPFDPAALRLTQDFAGTSGVKKLLTRIPVRKPSRQEFVRVNPSEEHRLSTMALELKEDREVFLVAPQMRDSLVGEAMPVILFEAITRQGTLFLWPCRLPSADGRSNPWHESSIEAANRAMEAWIRVAADMSLGAYALYEAVGTLAPPEWPPNTFAEILRIAFKDRFIDNVDHPVMHRLHGVS